MKSLITLLALCSFTAFAQEEVKTKCELEVEAKENKEQEAKDAARRKLNASLPKVKNSYMMCSTSADALGDLELYEDEKGQAMVRVQYAQADEDEYPSFHYKLTGSLKDIAKGDSSTLIAQEVGSEDMAFGGAIMDSILIRVLDGQKKGYFAANGNVFYLNCFPNEKLIKKKATIKK